MWFSWLEIRRPSGRALAIGLEQVALGAPAPLSSKGRIEAKGVAA